MRFMMSLPEGMHAALEDEMNRRLLGSVQEATRFIISEYFRGDAKDIGGRGVTTAVESTVPEEFIDADAWNGLQPLLDVAEVLGEPRSMKSVAELSVRAWERIGAIFGFDDKFQLSEDRKERLVSFLKDDDPGHARISLAFGALMALIEKDGILELEPYLQPIADILMEHIDQSIRSRSKRASDDESSSMGRSR